MYWLHWFTHSLTVPRHRRPKIRGDFMVLNIINTVLFVALIFCYFFQFIYIFIPFLIKYPPHKETKPHKYAVLICARNEENVIPNLIASLRAQDYPADLLSIFLMADNCTDNTAEVGRQNGITVYERFNKELIGKGYALNYLLECIDRDFGADAFDAFVVFDADNIAMPTFFTEINKTFSDGYDVITTYRNAKNYGDNWLAASSGLWFIREAKYLNGSRFRIGACPQVSGTGFLFSNKIKNENGGWPFHTLTEDYEFTCHYAAKGAKFGYCEQARFYDEQVTGFKQSWNQRMRWAKGGLQSFAIYWKKLLKGVFSKNFLPCYDMLMSVAPGYIMAIISTAVNVFASIYYLAIGEDPLEVLASIAIFVIPTYFAIWLLGFVCTLTEWKHLRTTNFKKILYSFTFPLFLFTFVPIALCAIFKKVEWKHIAHKEMSDEDKKRLGFEDENEA